MARRNKTVRVAQRPKGRIKPGIAHRLALDEAARELAQHLRWHRERAESALIAY